MSDICWPTCWISTISVDEIYSRVHNVLKNDIIICRDKQEKEKKNISDDCWLLIESEKKKKIEWYLLHGARFHQRRPRSMDWIRIHSKILHMVLIMAIRNLVSQYICVWKRKRFLFFALASLRLFWFWCFFTSLFFFLHFVYSFARALSAVLLFCFPFFVVNILYHYFGYTHSNA